MHRQKTCLQISSLGANLPHLANPFKLKFVSMQSGCVMHEPELVCHDMKNSFSWECVNTVPESKDDIESKTCSWPGDESSALPF